LSRPQYQISAAESEKFTLNLQVVRTSVNASPIGQKETNSAAAITPIKLPLIKGYKSQID
jgi:hypothetical protein